MVISKKLLVIISIIIISLASLLFGGCLESVSDRSAIELLSFSSDGTKLLSVTEFSITPDGIQGRDVQIWSLDSGEVIWRRFPSYENEYFLSPDGSYIITDSSIYNISSGTIVMNFSNTFQDWSIDGKILAMKNSSNTIEIWDALNFSRIKTISFNNTIESYHKIKFSPSGEELAYLTIDKNSISIVDISSNNVSFLENISVNFTNKYTNTLHKIIWSHDGAKIGLVYIHNNGKSYQISIWDIESRSLQGNIFVNNSIMPIISPCFERYGYINIPIVQNKNGEPGYLNYNDAVFEIYNLTNENKILELDTGTVIIPSYDWSYNSNMLVTGNNAGIIKIWDASTGKLIHIFETPIHEMPVPGFNMMIIMCAILVIFSLDGKKTR